MEHVDYEDFTDRIRVFVEFNLYDGDSYFCEPSFGIGTFDIQKVEKPVRDKNLHIMKEIKIKKKVRNVKNTSLF